MDGSTGRRDGPTKDLRTGQTYKGRTYEESKDRTELQKTIGSMDLTDGPTKDGWI